MGISYLRLLRDSDFRELGRDCEMYLPKAWCQDHGLNPGDDQVVVREEDDGTLTVMPPRMLEDDSDEEFGADIPTPDHAD